MGGGVVMARRLLGVVVVLTLVVTGATGCSTRKKPAGSAAAGAGLGEEGLGKSGSLERYKEGLPPGEEGPLKDIHFAFDSYELDEPSRGTLRSNGNWLKDHSNAKAEVEGHCDERGTVEYNL